MKYTKAQKTTEERTIITTVSQKIHRISGKLFAKSRWLYLKMREYYFSRLNEFGKYKNKK